MCAYMHIYTCACVQVYVCICLHMQKYCGNSNINKSSSGKVVLWLIYFATSNHLIAIKYSSAYLVHGYVNISGVYPANKITIYITPIALTPQLLCHRSELLWYSGLLNLINKRIELGGESQEYVLFSGPLY